LRPLGREAGGVAGVAAEQVGNHLFGIGHDPHDARMPVEARREKILDVAIRLGHRAGKRANRAVGFSDRICGTCRERIQAAARCSDHILDHRGDHPTQELMGKSRGIYLPVLRL
jgi:hypothetical protein